MREVIERSKKKDVKLITSVLTSVEVLQARLPVGMDTLFTGLMKRVIRIETRNARHWHTIYEITT